MRWAAYYSDGSVYRSEDHKWSTLPEEGMQFVVRYDEEGRRDILSGCDWYALYDGKWYWTTSGEWGTLQPKPEGAACDSCIKRGTRMEDEEFWALYRSAIKPLKRRPDGTYV